MGEDRFEVGHASSGCLSRSPYENKGQLVCDAQRSADEQRGGTNDKGTWDSRVTLYVEAAYRTGRDGTIIAYRSGQITTRKTKMTCDASRIRTCALKEEQISNLSP